MDGSSFTHVPRAPWHALPRELLAPTRNVPTMLSPAEQHLYLWLTAHWATGAGAVVDLGCFVGGSTARLAEGLRLAGSPSIVHAHDRFQASEHAKQTHLYPWGIPAFAGSDILPLASRLLAPWRRHVVLHPGEIIGQDWQGGPIEALVMDASKSKTSTDHMARIFFPHLIPGQSLVVQQDYLHWKTPWIAVQMARMARWFTPVAHAPDHTLVFRCDAPIDAQALAAGRVSDLTPAQTRAALLRARRHLRRLHIGFKVNALLAAVEQNPLLGVAWMMQRPAGQEHGRPP